MSWIPFALGGIAGFGLWGLLGKQALDHSTWTQVSLLFGVAVVLVFVVAIGIDGGSWSTRGVWLGALTGLAGAAGLAFFYLALDRGPASQVVPVIGIYPVLTAVLAVVFLGEAMSTIQISGVVLAVAGVLLVGLGS